MKSRHEKKPKLLYNKKINRPKKLRWYFNNSSNTMNGKRKKKICNANVMLFRQISFL